MSLSLSTSLAVHSAQVRMRLVLADGGELPVAQLGPDFVILEQSVELPLATRAEMILRVDDSERRWPVTLPAGVTAGAVRARIAR